MALLTNKDFLLEVARGRVTGHTLVRRVGINPDIDTAGEEDVISHGGTFAWPAAASPVASSSDADDIATTGTGARTIKAYGLNSSWAEVSETGIAMDGTDLVNFGTTFLFLDRVEIATTGSSETNEGDIDITMSGSTVARIPVGFGQSYNAVYYVPAGKTAYLVGWSSSLYKAVSGSVELRLMTAEDGVGWRVQALQELTQTGSGANSSLSQELMMALPAKTRIKVRAKTSVDNMGVMSSLTFIVV